MVLQANNYKYFEDQLLQPLRLIMNGVLQGAKMPETWKEVNIALLLKEGQNVL